MSDNDPKQPTAKIVGHPDGPTSTQGVEAGDGPGGGRGPVETDPGHELDRNVPQHTGEVRGSDVVTDRGLTGHPDARRADQETGQPARHGGNTQGNG